MVVRLSRAVAVTMLVALLATAAPARAVEEGIFSLAPEAGFAVLTGDLGDMVAGDLAFGAAMAYGIVDWFAVSGDALYSSHQQRDKDETGDIDLDHLVALAGPRFSYPNRLIVPYVGLLGGMTFIKYKAKWITTARTWKDEEDAHGYGGAVELGVDAFVHDIFTVGLAGRAGYFSGNLEYSHLNADGDQLGGYAVLAATLRLSILF